MSHARSRFDRRDRDGAQYTNGGTNPLEAGAYVVEYIKRMLKHQAKGITKIGLSRERANMIK